MPFRERNPPVGSDSICIMRFLFFLIDFSLASLQISFREVSRQGTRPFFRYSFPLCGLPSYII